MKILVAGMGNVLRGDDAFGIRVVQALEQRGAMPAGVRLYEAGIAGIPFVQELMDAYDALIIADAVDRGAEPGRLFVLEPSEAKPTELEHSRVHQTMVDAHYADPSKVLLLARALNVCPPHVFIVACQSANVEEACAEMTPVVERAVPLAVEQILLLLETLQTSVLHDAPSD
ncbi:MAG TPA: hydrogenase maturation protease [Blastocatellia bacterium]|nr:hydrogenase maturation protease [Blastocatellia bacterium]